MKIPRHYTRAGESPYARIPFHRVTASLRSATGDLVFEQHKVEVPKKWSQTATDILAQKYFRRKGIPHFLKRIPEKDIPRFAQRSAPDTQKLQTLPDEQRYTGETSAKQVFSRLAGTWTYWGARNGYFDSDEDAQAFCDEMQFMLACQIASPNSPQWFNTGLFWAYGIEGPPQGHWYIDEQTKTPALAQTAYERPQPHACFIQSVKDDLVGESGIMDLWVREARLFKYGSGTGSNFSDLRGENEPLSGGGYSSGLMSFLKIGDRAAGAIKSGGTTRRAAKMVVVDIDHPDIEEFIDWNRTRRTKSRLARRRSSTLPATPRQCAGRSAQRRHPEKQRHFEATNPLLATALSAARKDRVPESILVKVLQKARQGERRIPFSTFDTDWQGNAYLTVIGTKRQQQRSRERTLPPSRRERQTLAADPVEGDAGVTHKTPRARVVRGGIFKGDRRSRLGRCSSQRQYKLVLEAHFLIHEFFLISCADFSKRINAGTRCVRIACYRDDTRLQQT